MLALLVQHVVPSEGRQGFQFPRTSDMEIKVCIGQPSLTREDVVKCAAWKISSQDHIANAPTAKCFFAVMKKRTAL